MDQNEIPDEPEDEPEPDFDEPMDDYSRPDDGPRNYIPYGDH